MRQASPKTWKNNSLGGMPIAGPSHVARSARSVGLGGAQDSQDVGAD